MTKKSIIFTLLVGQVFLWTGSAFISVLYRLYDFYEPFTVTMYTEVLYYLMQAVGIGVFAVLMKLKPRLAGSRLFAASAAGLTGVLAVLALLLNDGVAVMASGLLMNFGIGLLSGSYLTRLTSSVAQQCRARVFGISYAIGSVGTWLLSLPMGGVFLQTDAAVFVYAALAVLSVFLARFLEPIAPAACSPQIDAVHPDGKLLAMALALPLVCSLVNGLGCYFSAADLTNVLDPVFTRVFYAVGLIAAGIVNDKNRRYGAVCCVIALIFPFVSLALRGEVGISAALSIFSYIFYGFFSVYRVVLFADLAGKRSSLLFLAVFGLLAGRIGDALGTLGGALLAVSQPLLTGAAAVFFVLCVLIFFSLYHRLYLPPLSESENTEALLSRFESRCGFTSRQSEIFRLVVKGCSNAEISSELFLSESTVKFHMKNILKKAECANRTQLIALYKASSAK